VPYIQDECTEMSDNFKKNMNQFLSGMKRTVAKAKAESGESLDEGKKYMSFEVYSKLCDLLFIGKGDDYLFAHAFLTLEWNLLSCSDNCFALYLNHVQWANDSMVVYFGKAKGDQFGEKSCEPWHVYSNPNMPSLCPVLAMAKY